MMRSILLICSAAFFLTACGDKLQSAGGVKGDVAAYQGADNKFVAPGWKAGDKTSWESALKARMQYSQNEYTRSAAK
jgi:hypothetical protein